MNKKIMKQKKEKNGEETIKGIILESLNFIFKGKEIHNPISFLIIIIFPCIALVISFFMIIYRFIKLIFKKGEK